MRTLTFNSVAGSNTVEWIADEDLSLKLAGTVNGSGVVSFDPSLTWANFVAPSVDGVIADLVIPAFSDAIDFPILKGQSLYVAFGVGAGVIYLFLEQKNL